VGHRRNGKKGKNVVSRPRAGGQGASHVTDCITVDMWTYNFGPHRLVHKLIFKSGRLTAIQTHGYGQ